MIKGEWKFNKVNCKTKIGNKCWYIMIVETQSP